MPDHDEAIATLYQLPLDEFTPARNALAKSTKHPGIKELQKPSVPAWAVNQLFWRERDLYDRLVAASSALRREHHKMLGGKAADVASADRAHREVLREASDAVRQILVGAGQAVTQATLVAVGDTLQALPSSETPGQLTKPLKPLGFEALAGVTLSGARPALEIVAKSPRHAPASQDAVSAAARAKEKQREEEAARKREAERRAAQEALRAAEAAMLAAETEVKVAEKALQRAKTERDRAVADYQRARLKAHE